MSLKKYNIGYNAELSVRENCAELMKSDKINKIKTFEHVSKVAETGVKLAERFGADSKKVETACLLHDISVMIPREEHINLCREYHLEILPEEEQVPLLLHQKISGIITREIFAISDAEILSAITCHTTLKAAPSLIDMIVFIADKIAWDQEYTAPFLELVEAALESSLEAACVAYTDYMIDNNMFFILHPEALAAQKYLKNLKKHDFVVI
jgi:predicted HD superfamily hydrolase involved in NAD metabolism